jgi:metal-responsive CopG/Arc/MetJ family transcriptional regulator
MSAHGTPKTERLNVLISESIVEDIDRVAASKGISKSAFVRFAIENELERSQELELADAAETLAPLYHSDKELTAFLALDGEDWYE